MINSNDYQQLTRYWNISRTYVNETMFHQRIESECYGDKNVKLGKCFWIIYRDFRPFTTFYYHNKDNSTMKFDHLRGAADCKYQFEEAVHQPEENTIKLNVTSQCKTSLGEKDSLGGTSFDIFSESKSVLSWCSVLDYFDGNYTVTCPVNHACTNLTAFVEYEHFDGVSDNKITPMLHHIIPPSTEFCSRSSKFFIDSNINGTSIRSNSTSQQIIVMKSGVWQRSNDISNDTRRKYDFIWTDQKRRVIYNDLETYLKKYKLMVHLLGDSNMRENHNLIIENLRLDRLNNGSILTYEQNTSFYGGSNWGLNYTGVVFSTQQLNYLKLMCSTFERSGEKDQKRVLVIQNGPWDLAQSSLRLPLQNLKNGLALINLIADILFGLIKCGTIYRIVYLTPVPHSLCHRESFHRCEGKRGYRTNSDLAALRDFYLDNLHTTISERITSLGNSIRPFQPQLHIVDVFDILRSRLIYPNETYNVDHFLCNCQNFFYETPGGVEVVNGLIFAISDDDLMGNATAPYKTYDSLFRPPKGPCNCVTE